MTYCIAAGAFVNLSRDYSKIYDIHWYLYYCFGIFDKGYFVNIGIILRRPAITMNYLKQLYFEAGL